MTRLYVGNIRYTADEASLRAAFEPFGPVKEVYIGLDRETGRSRGFAFVTMADEASATKARDGLNGKELDGRSLVVKEAQPRAARPPGAERGGSSADGSAFGPRRERAEPGSGRDQAAPGFRTGGYSSPDKAPSRGGAAAGPSSGRSGDREVNRARERVREKDRDRVKERDKQKFDRDDDW